jgi:hypothetical protein
MLSRELIEHATYCDSYRAPLRHKELGVVDIFFSIFGHRPWWVKLMLIARNKAVSLVGLKAPTAAEILNVEIRDRYAVGENIGSWPIFALSENELIAGSDNAHMDFRVSIMKVLDAGGYDVAVSTVCTAHNMFGRCYLFCVVPFHKRGVQMLMSNAVAAKRL